MAQKEENNKIAAWKVTIIVFIGMFFLYMAFVYVWEITSEVHKPANFLDFKVRTPEDRRDWFKRREDT